MGLKEYLELSDDQIANAEVVKGGVKGVAMIDISELMKTDKITLATKGVKEIVDACTEWGFFQITGHGVSEGYMKNVEGVSREFFKLPLKEKEKVKRSVTNSKGYFNDEFTKQKRDWKEGFDYGMQNGEMDVQGLDGVNQWPESPHNFERTMKHHLYTLRSIAKKLVEAMAVGLGVEHDRFEKHFLKDSSFMRLNYYPVCPNPKSHWSISHHTDAGAVTVLYQSMVNSLQVFNHQDFKWYQVTPIRNAFVINTGDIMQVWSNDKYIAPLHRVQARSDTDRFSCPLFYNPSYDTSYSPVTSPPAYTAINWGDFRMARFGGDYADLGTENQIAHFRIKKPEPKL